MRVAGIMSGTSLDGIDVAIVDIRGRRVETVGFTATPYPAKVRAAILGVSNCPTHTATISRLNFLLGELYARAVLAAVSASAQWNSSAATDRPSSTKAAPTRSSSASRPSSPSAPASRGLQLPRTRYRRRRPGRAAGSLRRLPAVPPSAPHSRRAQHRRHRQHHRDPGRLRARRCHRLRHRSRQHGDRRSRTRVLHREIELRSRRQRSPPRETSTGGCWMRFCATRTTAASRPRAPAASNTASNSSRASASPVRPCPI